MTPGLINITPDPALVSLGPIAIGWYGVMYVVGLLALVATARVELARRGIEERHLWNAFLLVGAFALVGARLYHVIDQWQVYQHDLLKVVLPPYSGLGLYGGIAGAALGIIVYGRWAKVPIRLGLDAVIPGTLFAQGIARWGNFFNQELYGPPTDAPWGIAIECEHRVAQYPCSDYPFAATGFEPLFFYESALDILGGLIALLISRRFLGRGLVAGDITAFWGIWYGSVRSILEFLRAGWNWTLGGIPTAQLLGVSVIVIGVLWIAWNHRPRRGAES
ncbi:MAG TPA: prolipoprotein diacylglyceryl transferase [Candidatus Limnocylindrales bacterium]